MPPFSLTPFSSDSRVADIAIRGSAEASGAVLRASYLVQGDLSSLVISDPSPNPARCDGLWKSTCFELFAAPLGQARYVEVNLCPSGDWNAYSFTAYREGMSTLSVASFVQRRLHHSPRELAIEFELTGDASFSLSRPCDLAITVVLEHRDNTRSYWSLRHTSDRPDFHKRDSFILEG